MWVQIVGKVRMALAPPLNHWWHITLYVTSRGLTTSPIPYQGREFQVDFDFIDHRLDVTESTGRSFTMMLEPMSVATFYREFMARLRELGIDVRIWPRPVEVPDAIPFEVDQAHASYDPGHAHAVWRGLQEADHALKSFQSGFVGKASAVHFFWGGFDLATTRYSGRPAPRHPGGIPNCPDWVMAESYSHEEASMGWWPWDQTPRPSVLRLHLPGAGGLRVRERSTGRGGLRSRTPRVHPPVRRLARQRRSGGFGPGVPAVGLRGRGRPRRLGPVGARTGGPPGAAPDAPVEPAPR